MPVPGVKGTMRRSGAWAWAAGSGRRLGGSAEGSQRGNQRQDGGLPPWKENMFFALKLCMLTIMAKPAVEAQSMDSLNASRSSCPQTPRRRQPVPPLRPPGFLLRRAHQISAAVFEDECRELALTPAQFGVLTVLRSHPGLGQSSLARALGFDKVTVLRVLRGLETRGFVARAPAADNKRNVSVALTAEGMAVLAQAQKPAEKAYKRLLAPLDKAQQAQLLELLQLLTGELEDDARAAFVPPG